MDVEIYLGVIAHHMDEKPGETEDQKRAERVAYLPAIVFGLRESTLDLEVAESLLEPSVNGEIDH
jgi:hypothetical protein